MRKNTIHPGYNTLIAEILPQLKGFESDITKHDKSMLTGYKGNFIIGHRDNGTNLYRLDALEDALNWEKQDHRKSLKSNEHCSYTFLTNNDKFLFVSGNGVSRVITEEDAVDFLDIRTEAASEVIGLFEKIDLKQIAYELMVFIKYNGRSWKSRLKDEWDSYGSSAALRRLRNYFEHGYIFKNITKDDDEEKIFSKLSISYVNELNSDNV